MIKSTHITKIILGLTLCFSLLSCDTFKMGKTARTNKPKEKTKEEIEAEQRIPTGTEAVVYRQLNARAGTVTKPRIEPSLWWIGMKNPTLEVLIYDQNIKNAEVEINHPGVRLIGQSGLENPNYLFLELEISSNAQPGDVNILVKSEAKYTKHKLTLKNRDANRIYAQGLTSADFVYLLMPDRFSNGDVYNDTYDDMQQRGIDRKKMFFRHGGDIQGVNSHLDYLKDLGVTTLWLNPVLENNQPYESYHGYAITDHYNVDKRYGTNALYTDMVTQSHKKGMKVMKDMIFNHVGSEHFFIKDLPALDWIHNHKEFKRSNYRDQIHYDPYASEADKTVMLEGWFDKHMPDLNQRNPKLARYLIQNSIWWIEYSGIDAYRIDTYPYNDQEFMRNWSKAILDEYPNFYICVESWVSGTTNQAHFVNNSTMQNIFGSRGIYPIDFQTQTAITEAYTRPQGWYDGVMKMYHTLATDYVYQNPQKNLIFLDNHDMSRALSNFDGDDEKLKSSLAWLLTSRGIPQMYYGTEILMKGVSNPDGYVRGDFPGGWKEDVKNKFSSRGRTREENDMFNFVKKLANYRKNNPVLHTGKLMQFIPVDGVYVYFRYTDNACVMVVMNTSDKVHKIDAPRFAERTNGYTKFKNVITDKAVNMQTLKVEKYQTLVIECQK